MRHHTEANLKTLFWDIYFFEYIYILGGSKSDWPKNKISIKITNFINTDTHYVGASAARMNSSRVVTEQINRLPLDTLREVGCAHPIKS